MLSAAKRALVLAPHTDDGEFGCGGTMARLVEGGVEVRYVAFSIATKSLPEGFPPDTLAQEVREATAEIGIPDSGLVVHDFEVRTFPGRRQEILELLIGLWEEWPPDAVFMPSLRDIHQDHQVIAAEGLRAFKRTTVLGYEMRAVGLNAAAARPLRLHAVEAAVVGKPRNEQTAELAGQIAVQGTQALRHNGYKIPLMRNLVKRAIRGGDGSSS